MGFVMICCFMLFLYSSYHLALSPQYCALRGCLHDTGVTFVLAWVHSSSPSWFLICLHDTTMKCHTGASHHNVSSPRLLYRRVNFSRKVHVCENEIVPYENVIFKHFISLCYKLILSSIKIRHLFTLCKAKYR